MEFADISEYKSTEVTPEIVVKASVVGKKKRKRSEENKAELDVLRQKARYHCSAPQQWKSVSRYSLERLKTFVMEKEFEQEQHLYEHCNDFVHKAIALVVDKMTMSDGYTETEILADLSLASCIKEEMSSIVQFMNRRVKTVVLLAMDVFHGKRAQQKVKPERDEVIEEINAEQHNETSETCDGNGQFDVDGQVTEQTHAEERDGEEGEESLSMPEETT